MFFPESDRIADEVPVYRDAIEQVDAALGGVQAPAPQDVDPGFLAASLGLDVAQIKWVLDKLGEQGLLDVIHLAICPDTGGAIDELPPDTETLECDLCGQSHVVADLTLDQRYVLNRLAEVMAEDIPDDSHQQDPPKLTVSPGHSPQFWGAVAAIAAVVIALVAVAGFALDFFGAATTTASGATPTP